MEQYNSYRTKFERRNLLLGIELGSRDIGYLWRLLQLT